ncbi:MAG: hypothetical protein CMM87_00440 [Rickettsiales bacterium]|nr:hypothetical protein [Rickettsiales bacterium]|tara:strand:- start:98419 stop:98718 length:300 start_codon:yes stop_codon:yes gene_type:complete
MEKYFLIKKQHIVLFFAISTLSQCLASTTLSKVQAYGCAVNYEMKAQTFSDRSGKTIQIKTDDIAKKQCPDVCSPYGSWNGQWGDNWGENTFCCCSRPA